MSLLEIFNQKNLSSRPKVRPGDIVRVYQKDPTKEGGKLQIFEGVIIAQKHGFGRTATITVRRETGDVAVEKIYPLHSPVIEKIEIVQRSQVRRAKLYYLRKAYGKRARLKRKDVDLDNIGHTKVDKEEIEEVKEADSEGAEVIEKEAEVTEAPVEEKTE